MPATESGPAEAHALERAQVVLAEVVRQDQAVVEEALDSAVMKHSDVSSPLAA